MTMIEPQDIERLKNGIDLAGYIASRGITLSRNGKNHKALCPFHQETSPSFTVNPEENLWHCFGCGAGGDVFTFVERLDKVSFTKAVGIVGRDLGKGIARQAMSPPSPRPSPIEGEGVTLHASRFTPAHPASAQVTAGKQKLLNRVVQFYQQELWKDKRGLNYLKQRGIADKQSLLDFGVGFVNGNLNELLPSDGDYEAALKQMGLLNKRGHEMFYGSVVFPLLDFNNNCVGLYGRRIDEEQVKHLYLPGPRRGLINRQAAKRSKTLLLTESIIDALSLYCNGFKNVIPLYGVNGWTEDHTRLFQDYPPDTVYLCFDSDEGGIKGAYAIKEKLRESPPPPTPSLEGRGDGGRVTLSRARVHIVKLPVKDLNDYFRKYRAEEFESLLKEANPQGIEESEDHYVKEERFYEETPHGFCVGYGKREYEIKGIARVGTQLKATIKASLDIKAAHGRFEITTIDLYSIRSKEWFAKVVRELTGEREEMIREDFNRLIEKVEIFEKLKGSKKKTGPVVLSPEEKREAFEFLQNPRLFDEILSDLEHLGCTGEETNKLVAYLVAVSRKMEEPLALLIQSRSAAGKSTLQDAILSLVPEEDFIKYTRLTDQALFYKEEDSLVHKILAIEEAKGMGGAAYSIRAMQSSKQLTVATTSKDPATGKMKTEEYKVNGPLALMLTTTEIDIDAEMESRFITIAIDETKAMTEKIHQKQREQETLEGYIRKKRSDKMIQKHQNAQRLLKPLAVVNPYAPHLAFPSENLRSRRDHKKYLNLMKAIAFLHQYQREIRQIVLSPSPGLRPPSPTRGEGNKEVLHYVEVTLDDIERANKLANEILGQSLDDLSAPSRTLLSLIHKMVTEKCKELNLSSHEFSFNRRTVREHAKWSDWQVKTHIRELEDLGYVYSRLGSKGKEYVYELHHEVPAEPAKKIYLDLTEISQLLSAEVRLGWTKEDEKEKYQNEKTALNLEGSKEYLVAL